MPLGSMKLSVFLFLAGANVENIAEVEWSKDEDIVDEEQKFEERSLPPFRRVQGDEVK